MTALKTHPLCSLLRELRHASGMSLGQVEDKHGISAVVLGSYERGDRMPPVTKLDEILRHVYGYELRAVPIGTAQTTILSADMIAALRAIADQLEDRLAVPAVS